MSQFHFGSIQTLLISFFEYSKYFVSIPLWFNSNCRYLHQSRFYTWCVSIPLWFNSNTSWEPGDPVPSEGLNSTLVQFKRLIPLAEDSSFSRRSQFHFGSIQTPLLMGGVSSSRAQVSIPLWFNSNWGSLSIKTGTRWLCLNSTLVQFKR